MAEPSWIFILAMATFALAIGFAIFSIARTRRERREGRGSAQTSVPRETVTPQETAHPQDRAQDRAQDSARRPGS